MVLDDLFVDMCQHARLDLVQFAANARAGRQLVPPAAVTSANRAHVQQRRFRAHAHAHQTASNSSKNTADEHRVDPAQVVDEALVVLGLRTKHRGGVQRQGETGRAPFGGEFHRIEQRAQEF